MTKSSALRLAFLRGHVSRTYNKIGMHFPLMSWRTDCLETILPTLTIMELIARWKERFA